MKRHACIATLATGLLTLALMPQLYAQEKEHGHTAPHGGLVVTVANDYHFELVVKKKELNVYVLNASEKTLPVKDMTGDIVLLMGKERKTLRLSPSGEFLKANGDFATAEKFTAVATVKLKGKDETGRFVYTKGAHQEEMNEKHHDEK